MNDKVIKHLEEIIKLRKKGVPKNSYVAKLFKKGKVKIANKLGEEAVEVVSAFLAESKNEILDESADLLFHLIILLEFNDLSIEDVFKVLEKRMKSD